MGVFSRVRSFQVLSWSEMLLDQICQQLNLKKVKSCFVAQSVGKGTLHLMK